VLALRPDRSSQYPWSPVFVSLLLLKTGNLRT
jgi:hypothetical protein